MKSKDEILYLFGKDSIASRFIECVLETVKKVSFDDFLDYSFNNNVIISTDFGGEDPSSDHFIYTATFSTFMSAKNWMYAIKDQFKKLGYNDPPQYKDISHDSQNGKFVDFLDLSKIHFKGFVVSLAIPKNIECIFSDTLENNYEYIKKVAGISNFKLSVKNTEKALRIATLISIILYHLSFYNKRGGYFWISDKDAIAKVTRTDNLFENTVQLQMNILSNLLDGKLPDPIGYSLPWKDDEEDLSYILIALNDLFSGAFADFSTNASSLGPSSDNHKVKNKSSAILYNSKEIPKYFYKIQSSPEGFYSSRIEIEVSQ
ncbi:hypothetical protein HGB47_14965 [Leptospira yasudae]|uniref:hypothetical protein n=1 Tax=Leptospira yasudae TaxID=2202201 RepID=UPI001C4F7DED|nr:hypothetical protein [Leptospira yasudae]MBW0434918.1 hypothetical protein [Leptospira yasudae]